MLAILGRAVGSRQTLPPRLEIGACHSFISLYSLARSPSYARKEKFKFIQAKGKLNTPALQVRPGAARLLQWEGLLKQSNFRFIKE